jgi:hypothetical protein
VTFPLLPPPLPMERLLKTWLFQLWWPIHFLFFFLFFLMMWSIFHDQGAGDSGKSTIFKQVGRNSLLFQVWTCVCQHCCFLSLCMFWMQIKLLFQSGFDEAELKSYISVIHANVYQTIKVCKTWNGVLVIFPFCII